MILGKNGKWMWLTSKAACLKDVVELCPQLVIDRFVLITSYDSGYVTLTDEHLHAGWQYTGGDAQIFEWRPVRDGQFALSPRVSNAAMLPIDMYDEWYVFYKPPVIHQLKIFVNAGFSPTSGKVGLAEETSSEYYEEFETHFWQQLSELDPRAYVADNFNLSFVTSDEILFEQVVLAVQDVEQEVSTACDAKSPTDPNDCST